MEQALAGMNLRALAGRLLICAQRAGGKRALAVGAGFSEAQMYRYLDGDVVVPSDRLLACARTAKVDPSWLLTGDGGPDGPPPPDVRPGFRPELLAQVNKALEETLLEMPRKLSIGQKSRILALIYESFLLEDGGKNLPVDKGLMLDALEFVAPVGQVTDVDTFHKLCERWLLHRDPLTPQEALTFERLVAQGNLNTYNGLAGQIYFNRMGQTLSPDASRRLLEMVEQAQLLVGKQTMDWLDLGCGNGRHLAFLKAHATNVNGVGLEPSALALSLLDTLVKAQKLSADNVLEGDARQMPLPDASMDVVYWRMGAHHWPYLKGHEVGLLAVLGEIRRVLRPHGVVFIISYWGENTYWLPFMQQQTEGSLGAICAEAGLAIAKFETTLNHSDNGGVPGRDFTGRYMGPSYIATLKKA